MPTITGTWRDDELAGTARDDFIVGHPELRAAATPPAISTVATGLG